MSPREGCARRRRWLISSIAALAAASSALSTGAVRAQTAAAAPAGQAAGQTAASENPEARLARLEKEVEALKAELARMSAPASGGSGSSTGAAAAAGDPARLAEIDRRLDILSQEIERLRLGEQVAGATTSESGMGPAASKIYHAQPGVSLGGYGEALYQNFNTRRDNGAPSGVADDLNLLRGVVYVGYKWNDHWLLNSELEWENANTERGGESAVEFAYIDYRWKPELSFRGGLLLMPVGIINEFHEPTTFLSTRRPDVETLLIPSTWRESGIGLYGESGPFQYRAYLTGGLDASGFASDVGLREGSHEGSNASANDFAGVVRLDWTPRPGLLAGFSLFHGGSGQGLTTDDGHRIQVGTTLGEAHLEWSYRGFQLRAIGVQVSLSDVADLDRILALSGDASVGSRLTGGYVELGYNLFSAMPHGEQSLTPFVRYERTNTQASVPSGFQSNPANDVTIWTAGVAFKPITQLVFKADYQNYDNRAGSGLNQLNLSLGYIF